MTTDVTLAGDRFEITVDGTRAGLAQFLDAGAQRIFFHTEVGEEFEGQWLAGELVARALDATREADLRVVPVCPTSSGSWAGTRSTPTWSTRSRPRRSPRSGPPRAESVDARRQCGTIW